MEVKKVISFDLSLCDKKCIEFEVPGRPFAKQRPRAAKKGKYITIYTPRETKEYEGLVQKYFYKTYGHHQDMLAGPLKVNIEGVFEPPASASKKKQGEMIKGEVAHTQKPDCDNMGKVCLDALNRVAFDDDSQIDELYIKKSFGQNAKVIIKIEEH